MKPVKVAVLGAAGTGKTALTRALKQTLTPVLTNSSASSGAADESGWLITDESPLQIWLSEQTPESLLAEQADTTKLQAVLTQQLGFDHHLLLALDIPAPLAAGLADGGAQRQQMDALLRSTLVQAGLPFQVIYGLGEQRLAQALAALGKPAAESGAGRKTWVWVCDKCSDPVCEHRLLSDLLASRQA
jgi:nicotinamide riboside kinase